MSSNLIEGLALLGGAFFIVAPYIAFIVIFLRTFQGSKPVILWAGAVLMTFFYVLMLGGLVIVSLS